jgi:integrase
MKGNLRKRTEKGGWQITIWTGTKADGKPQRYYETVKGKKADAQRRLRELLTTIDSGIYTPPSHLTVAQLLQEWQEGYCKTHCCYRTLDVREYIARCHLIPAFGHIKLDNLQSRTIQAFYGKACETLSNRTVLHIHRILSQALKWAVRQGYIARNPAEMVDPPVPENRNMTTLSPDEVCLLLERAQGNTCYGVIYTAISTGLRRNEILGLHWRDVDLLMASISITQVLYKGKGRVIFKEPKTQKSRRRISITPKLACFLREHQQRQEQVSIEQGKTLAIDDLVFCHPDGNPLDPSTVTHSFGNIARSLGLKVRFHDLRHSCASLMLREGVHPKIVSEMLGHSTIAITLDVYSHIMPGMQEAAAKSLNSVLPAAVSII